MFKKTLSLLLLVMSLPSLATFPPQAAIKKLPNGHDLALMIVDPATNQVLYSQREEQLQVPASTQKMITALAATLYLDDNYRFNTDLEVSTNDIILRFNGDPTLSRADLASLLKALKKNNLSTIKGNLYLNGNAFSGYERAAGWPWDILGVCYSAPSSSITLEHNCVQGALYSNKAIGQQTRINIPSHQPIKAVSNALIVTKEQQKQQHCELELVADPSNSYQLSGCLPQSKKPLPLNFAVQNTEAYTSAVIQQELQRAGIQLKGKILRNDDIKGKRIARHQSAPLSDLVDIMLKKSDNLIADNLTKTLGREFFKQAGTFNNGVAAIKAILQQQANIDLTDTIMVDGSGLSRNNRIKASSLMQVITYIYNTPSLGLLKDMPVSGESGTLLYRQSIRQAPLKGNIVAKSGSLYGSYNLAGMIKVQSGKTLLFIQLVNNYFPPDNSINDKPITPPITEFEKALYLGIYNEY
jgi:serine-type D-Ala-D-Ala carboxypeptidase/endopeptidase (penicillin-binding protein 4)